LYLRPFDSLFLHGKKNPFQMLEHLCVSFLFRLFSSSALSYRTSSSQRERGKWLDLTELSRGSVAGPYEHAISLCIPSEKA
jgi:hypothetical protein